MRDDDHPLLLARRLRDGMVRGDWDDDLAEPRAVPVGGDEPLFEPADDVDASEDVAPASDPVTAGHARGRRWRRNKDDTSDSVQIDEEDGHAWWADREGLDQLVNPKKRGAAERARQAAQTAFAPEGSRGRPDPTRAPRASSDGARWSPNDVFSWTTADDAPLEGQGPIPEPRYSETPWQVLGLTSDASWREVTRRHRHLALEHHPDRHGGSGAELRDQAESRMSDINAAFSELRRIYQLTDGV